MACRWRAWSRSLLMPVSSRAASPRIRTFAMLPVLLTTFSVGSVVSLSLGTKSDFAESFSAGSANEGDIGNRKKGSQSTGGRTSANGRKRDYRRDHQSHEFGRNLATAGEWEWWPRTFSADDPR